MIRAGSLTAPQRVELMGLARSGLVEHRVARRANALLLLDEGWSCERVAEALFVDEDTVRRWGKCYLRGGLAELTSFDVGGSASHLTPTQEDAVRTYLAQRLPRTTRQIGAFIEKEFGVVYESRSGLIALSHRLGLEYLEPELVGRKLDADKQRAFLDSYEKLLNSLGPDEAVVFADAVHPTHAARPVGCWAPKKGPTPALEQTSGRQRPNVHGAIDLKDRQDRF